MGSVYRFDGFTFSTVHQALARDGVPVMVGSRGLDLLARLLEQPGEVVTVDELMRTCWGKLRVQPNNLSVQMSALRKALGPRPGDAPLIRTVSGRGYMLCAAVVRDDDPVPGHRWPGAATTSFVGRTAELDRLRALLGQARVVTVIGAGGVGKTRLVQELVRPVTHPWAGVDLAPTVTDAQVLAAIASALGEVNATMDAVVARLRASPLQLILDNAEHVTAHVGSIVGRILSECPQASVLITSRITLRISGEVVFRLDPMLLPSPAAATLAEIGHFDGVRMFAERAAAAQPGFTLSEANCGDVADLCRQLDGLPLAIEMLVPRLRAMSLKEVMGHLDRRFSLLGSSGPDVLPRQRTLHTMLDWSCGLLDEAEWSALVRLAIFRTPATLPAVRGIGPEDGTPGPGLLDAMAGLTDKSLATAELSGGETRFRLMQTTRDYVVARIPPADLRRLRSDHLRFMADWFEDALDAWPTAPTTAWLDRNGAYLDDIREALSWTAGRHDDGVHHIRLALASLPLWLELPGTPLGEMTGWFDRVAPALGRGVPPLASAWFRIGQSWRATQFGDVQHRAVALEAVAAARSSGNNTVLGVAVMRHGHTLMQSDTMDQAAEQFLAAEHHLRADPPGKWLCLTLGRRADAIVRLGALEQGLRVYEEAIGLAHALEFRLGQVVCISNMTEVLFTLGEQAEAIRQLHFLVGRVAPGARSPAMATLAAHLALDGQPDAAFAAAADVAEWAPVTGMPGPLAWAAETVALMLARSGRLSGAATMAGYARKVLPAVDIRFGSRRAVFLELADRLASGLRAADLDALGAAGATWTLPKAASAVSVACRSEALTPLLA